MGKEILTFGNIEILKNRGLFIKIKSPLFLGET